MSVESPTKLSKMLVLEGRNLYEDGRLLCKLDLQEGARSQRMVIVERACFSDLKKTDLKSSNFLESKLTEAVSSLCPSGSDAILCVLEGRLQMADLENANGRIYPDALWEKILGASSFVERVKRGEMLGEVDHPRDGETLLSRVGCMVTEVGRGQTNSKEIRGRIVVFNTESGRKAATIIAGGGRVGASSRGKGSVVRREGIDFVQEDFELETWDLVHNPSTPDAYPSVESASWAGSRHERATTMDDLKTLTERFHRLRARVSEGAHQEVVGLVRDEVTALQETAKSLRVDPSLTGSLAGLIAESSVLLSTIGKTKKQETEEPADEMPADDECSESDDEEPSDDEAPEESKRPETQEHVREWLRKKIGLSVSYTETKEIADFCRTRYRKAFKVEGALARHEINAIQEHVKSVLEAPAAVREAKMKASTLLVGSFDQKAVAEAIKPFGGRLKGTTVTASFPKASLRSFVETVQKFGSRVVVVDQRDLVYQECAEKFSGLLEQQTAKAMKAVAEAASARASTTGLSAQVTALRQVVEQMVVRTRSAEGQKTDFSTQLEAAVKIIDAVASEVQHENLRGAVEAAAATHPHLPGLAEALCDASSVREVVQITNRLVLESLPRVEREPTVESSGHQDAGGKRFADAINESERARGKAESKETRATKFATGRASVEETSHRVAARMDKLSGRG